MPRQRAIRFPDDLHDAIEAEARRLGHPHTFSSVIVNAARQAVEKPEASSLTRNATKHASWGPVQHAPSPSLARFANPKTKR